MHFLYVLGQGDAVLITTFLLLISMSLISWYIIFWKAWNIYKERAQLNQFKKRYMTSPNWPRHAVMDAGKGGIALLIGEAEKTRLLLGPYEKAERKDIVGMHLSQALDVIRSWLDKGLTVLASVGTSAPFIGLFGTVWGIYGALTRIAVEGNASLNVVAGPMGEALIATAVGLFAAIPAVLAYNAFVRINRLLVQDLRHIAEQLTMYLSEEHKRQDKESDIVTLLQKGGA